ncbi:MAG: hypothetical protein IJJ74_02900 [Eubacterium sp.]|nr:hypothetical protein [Eubacterium sp.]
MKKKKNSKVINLIKDSKMNVAIIIFAAILLYVAISVVISMKKEPVATYKVGDSDISDNISCTGIAIRNEITVKTSRSGYITYFTRNNDKVRKGSAVCTIDDTGNIISSSESPEAEGVVLTQKDYQEIRKTISLYKTNYDDITFYKVYNFKDEISSQILDVANQMLVDKLHTNQTAGSAFQYMYSPVSGILCFYTDGYEDKKVENITAADFDSASYVKNSFASGDIVNSNSVVYKMIEDEKWNIVCKISPTEAEKLKDEEYLEININNSNFNLYVNFEIIEKGADHLLNISMKKYMSTFANERFLNVEIMLDSYEGLKIPNSSIVRKKVYLLPEEYAAAGGNASTKNKVYRQAVDQDGNPTIEQITLDIYDERDGYLLVNPDTFQPTDVLIQLDTNNKLNVSLLASDDIEGVYLANEGVAQFIEVKVERSGEEFTVVSTGGSLRKYDNIIMDSSKVSENQTIY